MNLDCSFNTLLQLSLRVCSLLAPLCHEALKTLPLHLEARKALEQKDLGITPVSKPSKWSSFEDDMAFHVLNKDYSALD